MKRIPWPLLLVVAASGCTAARTATAGHPSRGALPGFVPAAFSAVSERDLWVLGTAPCAAGRCTALVRTDDGGRTFAKTGAPPLRVSPYTPSIQFANQRDGFAYVPPKSFLYATHDGGASWRRQPMGRIVALATSGSVVYVVTARSRLEFAAASSTTWTARPMPFAPDGGLVDLSARGRQLWLLGTPVGNGKAHDRLARSADGGRTFTTGAGPCYPDLGGTLTPGSAGIVWALCPTGMMAGAFRSTDDGVTFAPLRTRPLVNSSRLAAASGTTAVLFGNGAGLHPLLTTDGGRSWSRVETPRRPIDVSEVEFVDPHVGFALAQTGPTRQDLWRTTDGGARWSAVRLR